MPPRLRQVGITLATQALVALAACAYIAATCRIPLPMSLPLALAEAFPCQQHGCGCVSAEVCRTECCCFTAAERIRWAVDHNQRSFLAPAERLIADRADVGRAIIDRSNDASPAACAGGGGSCCARLLSLEAAEACCSTGKSQARFIQLDLVRRCRGLQDVWLVCFLALPPVPRGKPELLPRAEVLIAGTVSIDSRTVPPPVPPPERASSAC